ncbi:MAG: hypothetical protein NWE79_03540 [Candidatus Bathyarchaeota archaeon]|nr:hypothetical protein [Candidatus Bathyarchaeota archaeon]
MLTEAEHVLLDFDKPTQRLIREMSVEEAERYLDEDHFLPWSMGPKVEAYIRFLMWGGRSAIISSLEKLIDALDGKTDTHIYNDARADQHEP